ncbi:MAG: 50S ribosomal protein L17 [Chloroflexi bacterium]|nr:50S ribosomal protein L17 [Chloroflexota bacterium]
MRHRVAGRHFGRDTAHRTAMYRNLITDLLRYERITTTEAKAKEIRPMAERIITLARRGDLHARRQAQAVLFDTRVTRKVFDEIGPRMKDRPGGYLRITGVEPRKGDAARMAVIELVDFVEAPATPRPQRVTAAPTAPSAVVPATAAPAEIAEAEPEDAAEPVEVAADETPEVTHGHNVDDAAAAFVQAANERRAEAEAEPVVDAEEVTDVTGEPEAEADGERAE